MNQPIRCSN